ncbi:hypothetical protein BpHYR1_052506 [Brachionus plicatilis]|uniref:Uncharacterized protein n=1 Tax=Brachionus plicatilis TaxID=10195 RepID=A0A3M7SWF6_BRAPC|nr:hypothetical protein BpHYR1_052506 [Brachionus plicatilis]
MIFDRVTIFNFPILPEFANTMGSRSSRSDECCYTPVCEPVCVPVCTPVCEPCRPKRSCCKRSKKCCCCTPKNCII